MNQHDDSSAAPGPGRSASGENGMAQGEARFFANMVRQSRLAMVATDLRLPDRPLVFVNDAFVSMTGYRRDEVLGRNCRFLQGPSTDSDTVRAIRETIEAGETGYFELRNYRRDGTAFWNGLHIGPAERDPDGGPSLYFGAQRDVTVEVEAREGNVLRARELTHRMGNLLAIVNAIVASSARGGGEDALRAAVRERLRALSLSNALVAPDVDGSATGTVPVSALVETVLAPIADDERFDVEGPDVEVAHGDVTNLALVLHELATNALKHGALSNERGSVKVSWRREDGRTLLDWNETGGPAPEEAPGHGARRGMGSKLLKTILQGSRRPDAVYDLAPEGVTYRFDIG